MGRKRKVINEIKNEMSTMSFTDIMKGLAEAIAIDQQQELMKKNMSLGQFNAINTQNIFLLTFEKEELFYSKDVKSAITKYIEKAINKLIEKLNPTLTIEKLTSDLDYVFEKKVSTEQYNSMMNKIRRFVAEMFFEGLISKAIYEKFHNENLNTIFEKNKAK